MDKLIDKKSIEDLAILIASKTGLDENPAAVARKVIADYVSAKKLLGEYNEATEKAAKQLAKQGKEKKTAAGKKLKKSEPKTDNKASKKKVSGD